MVPDEHRSLEVLKTGSVLPQLVFFILLPSLEGLPPYHVFLCLQHVLDRFGPSGMTCVVLTESETHSSVRQGPSERGR